MDLDTPALKRALTSVHPEEIGYALATLLIKQTLKSEAARNTPELPMVLNNLTDALFGKVGTIDSVTRDKQVQTVLSRFIAPNEISSFYARLGHIQQLAGLIARDNLFSLMREKNLPIAGGVKELVEGNKRLTSANAAVTMLSKPVFGLTFTAHPTSVNGLASVKAQRALGIAIDALRAGKTDAAPVIDAMHAFASIPLSHMDEKGTPAPMSVRDETEHMLYALGNVYDDLPSIYKRFDDPLRRKFKDTYAPESLKLRIDLSSWGSSGDKDGNKNVNATTTLHAIALHKHTVFSRYIHELSAIQHPALSGWMEKLTAASHATAMVVSMAQKYPLMNDAEWKKATDALRKNTSLDAAAFVGDIETAYKESPSPELLNLLRRVRIFGFTMGRIEYRETAEEYTRIAGLFIKDYDTMSEAKRMQALNTLLDTPTNSVLLEKQAVLEAIHAAQQKPYSTEDAHPIAAQTLRRMELARDFPDMVKDNVLAECQNTSNFLEALLMQKLAEKDGKKPLLGIVPLFEEYRVLERAGDIMTSALTNGHYKTHLEALKTQNNGTATQQVQLAHSDNARRAGMPAARAYIYEAHKTLRKAVEKHGVAIQFFEGGSQSDPYRGGVRSMTASMNEFGIHDFAKFTFQGGDLLNYLNYPASSIRLFTRNIAHAADVLAQKEPEPVGKHTAALNKKQVNSTLDEAATAALKKSAKDYENKIFKNPKFGRFLKEIGYLEETEAGGKTSRAAARSNTPARNEAQQVDVEKTRTIAFSEAFQHAGICPTWIGAQNVYGNLCMALNKEQSPADLHALYKASPVFADVIDRMLFGLAKTNLSKLNAKHSDSHMMQTLALEYRYAFELAMEAKTGRAFPDRTDNGKGYGALGFDVLQNIVINEGLPHLASTLAINQRYLHQVDAMKQTLMTGTISDSDKDIRTVLHNAGDTVHHGRILAADDHTYGQLRMHYEAAVSAGEKNPETVASKAFAAGRNGAAISR